MVTSTIQVSKAFLTLLPQGTVTSELIGQGSFEQLYAEEKSALSSAAVVKRRSEFAAGRQCARHCLLQLEIQHYPLTINADRSPHWPTGIVGSITHTHGYCAVAAVRQNDIKSIGIDVEQFKHMTPSIYSHIATAREQQWLQKLSEKDQQIAATLLFSAKESFYKCQYPVSQRQLNFDDVEIEIPNKLESRGGIKINLLKSNTKLAINNSYQGNYMIDHHMVMTAFSLV